MVDTRGKEGKRKGEIARLEGKGKENFWCERRLKTEDEEGEV